MDLYSVRRSLSLGIPLSELKLRVTEYSRVSTSDVKQHNSLKNQINHFSEMIKNNNNWVYVKGYVDDGITGISDIKRDNFMKMIEDGKKGKFDLIITKEISRFSRNTLDSIRYTRELLQNGVAVLFVNDNINTIFPDSELRLTIMASVAQDEIRRLSERVKFGMNRAIMDGHILGNDRLYGYKKNKISGNLEIDIEQSKILKKIYDMYVIDNMSLNKIVKYLNEHNIKTSMNKKFSVSTLSRMLRNPKYKGFYCGKKTEIVDYMTKRVKYFKEQEWIMYKDILKIPPIIDEKIWQLALKKLESRNKKIGKSLISNCIYKNKYPLSTKLICKNHETIFYRRKLSNSSDDVVWWCSEYLNYGKKKCSICGVRQSELYFIFDDIIKYLNFDLDKVVNMLLKLYLTDKESINIENNLKSYEESIEKLKNKKEKLLELNMAGFLTNVDFKEKTDEYNNKILEINKKINKLIGVKQNFEIIKNDTSNLKQILDEKISLNVIRERLILLLLNKIVISASGNDDKDIELSFFLNLSSEYIKKEFDENYNFEFNSFFKKDYQFKRGYDKCKAKRYIVRYRVNCYFLNN